MTPKSLLRHKRCVSNLDEFTTKNTFHRILNDDAYKSKNGLIKLRNHNEIKKVASKTLNNNNQQEESQEETQEEEEQEEENTLPRIPPNEECNVPTIC